MAKSKHSNLLFTLTKNNSKLTKTVFSWDTTDLEKEVFRYGK
jgi:hypothetical protein